MFSTSSSASYLGTFSYLEKARLSVTFDSAGGTSLCSVRYICLR